MSSQPLLFLSYVLSSILCPPPFHSFLLSSFLSFSPPFCLSFLLSALSSSLSLSPPLSPCLLLPPLVDSSLSLSSNPFPSPSPPFFFFISASLSLFPFLLLSVLLHSFLSYPFYSVTQTLSIF